MVTIVICVQVDCTGKSREKAKKRSSHIRSRRLLPTPPDSDISTPSPPTVHGAKTYRGSSQVNKMQQPKPKPKFQSFISKSQIDQILKSNDSDQAAKDAWMRRKSYNPMAAAKAKKGTASTNQNVTSAYDLRDNSNALRCQKLQYPTSELNTSNKNYSSVEALALVPKKQSIKRQMSFSMLNSPIQARGNKYEIMFSSLIETKHQPQDGLGDKSARKIQPLQYRRMQSHLTNHSPLDHLIISTLANLTNKLCRTVSISLQKAAIMLAEDDGDKVCIFNKCMIMTKEAGSVCLTNA